MNGLAHIAAAAPSFAAAVLLQRWTGAASARRTGAALLAGMLATLTVVPAVRAATSVVSHVDSAWGQLLLFSLLAAAVPEEAVKWAVLLLVAAPIRSRKTVEECVLLGTVVGLGFAATENALYTRAEGMGVGLLRTLTVLPCHAALGAVMGVLLARAPRAGSFAKRAAWCAAALVVPITLHFLYDALVLVAALARSSGLRAAAGFLVALLLIGAGSLALRTWVRLTGRSVADEPRRVQQQRAWIFRVLGLGLIAMAVYLVSVVVPYALDPTAEAPERAASRVIMWGAGAAALFGAGLVLRGRRLGHPARLDARDSGTYVRGVDPNSQLGPGRGS